MTAFDAFTDAGRHGRPLQGELVIDAHGHLGQGGDFPTIRPTAEALVASMDRLGIRFTAISAIPAIFGDADRGNAIVAEALARHPGRFFGYVVTDVGYPDRSRRQLAGAADAGFRGLKVWSYGARPGLPYNDPRYEPVFAHADAAGWPVLAHVFGPEIDELREHLRRFTRARWLLAHVGSARLADYIRMAREHENVFLELCLSTCPRGLVEHLVEAGLEDQVVWGSDAVFLDQASQLGRVLFARIPEEAKRKILGRNAARVFGLDPAA